MINVEKGHVGNVPQGSTRFQELLAVLIWFIMVSKEGCTMKKYLVVGLVVLGAIAFARVTPMMDILVVGSSQIFIF